MFEYFSAVFPLICIFHINEFHLVCLYFIKKALFFYLNTDENITLMLLSSLFSMIFLIFMCIPSVITYLYFLYLFPINLLSFCLLFCFLIPHFLALLLPSFSLHTRHPLHPSIHSSLIQLGEEKCSTSSPDCQERTSVVS